MPGRRHGARMLASMVLPPAGTPLHRRVTAVVPIVRPDRNAAGCVSLLIAARGHSMTAVCRSSPSPSGPRSLGGVTLRRGPRRPLSKKDAPTRASRRSCGTRATPSSSASTRSAAGHGPDRSRSAPPCCPRSPAQRHPRLEDAHRGRPGAALRSGRLVVRHVGRRPRHPGRVRRARDGGGAAPRRQRAIGQLSSFPTRRSSTAAGTSCRRTSVTSSG